MRRARATRSRVADTFRRAALVCVFAAVLGLLVTAGVAAAAAAGVNITTVEGRSFTGNVVSGLSCPLASAAISWGDGTTSAGTSDGSTGIQGAQTYAEEGTYSGSVSYTYQPFRTCPTGTQTASFQATVQDAPLTATGASVSGTAGQALSGVVAHFSDANPAANAGEFSAQINWGDGARAFGTVSAAPAGGFDVSGTHTYNAAGSYAISVTITDLGGSSGTGSSAAQIAAAPPPPPPPPPQTNLTARFIVNPSAPCPQTKTFLDARDSTLVPGGTDTGYVWDIEGTDQGTAVYPSPVFNATFDFPYETEQARYIGTVAHNAPGYGLALYNVFDIHLVARPVQVTLSVQQVVPGRGLIDASQTKTITFTNPDVTLEMGFAGGIDPPPVWIVHPQQQHGCPAFTNRRFFGIKAVPRSVALAKLTTHSLVVLSSGRSIKLQAGCKNPLKDCIASLDVLSRAPKLSRAGTRTLPPSLGGKTFVVPAGKTITVTVPLNAHGKVLARAHKLHQVTLLLESVGAGGKYVPTIRTVQLRAGR